MDGLHHPLEHGIEDLARLLGIAVGEQLHRSLEVSEEDRDLLALALKRRLGRQDLLGQVLGGVGLRETDRAAADQRPRRSERLAALLAELCGRRHSPCHRPAQSDREAWPRTPGRNQRLTGSPAGTGGTSSSTPHAPGAASGPPTIAWGAGRVNKRSCCLLGIRDVAVGLVRIKPRGCERW